MQALLDINDPDWGSFNSNDPEYLLRVCGETVRRYCGWHIFPNVQLTKPNLQVGSRGMLMLPATYVTAVESITLQSVGGQSDVTLDPTQYTWFKNGAVEPIGWAWYGPYAGFYYGPDNWSYLPVYQFGLATAVFNAGYDAVPDEVKEVAYELVDWVQTMKPGNVKEVASPGFRLALGGNPGMNLNDEQKDRLANFRIGAVI